MLCSPLPSAALLSFGLTDGIGSPSTLTRSQKRALPSSCAAQTIVGADDDVLHDMVPDEDALFDPTSNSDSAITSTVVEEDEPGAKRSRLADKWSESESYDDSDDDVGDDFESTSDDDGQKPCLDISFEDFDRGLARGYGCKDGSHSRVLPAQHVVSIQCQERLRAKKCLPPWLAGCTARKRHCRTRAVLVSL